MSTIALTEQQQDLIVADRKRVIRKQRELAAQKRYRESAKGREARSRANARYRAKQKLVVDNE